MHERTIDDLVGHVLANIVDRGGTHYADCEFDGQRHLVCVARTLAREVARLRAERDALVKVAIGVSEIINERESAYQCEWWMMDNAIDDYGRLPAAVRDEIEGLRDPFNTEADQ